MKLKEAVRCLCHAGKVCAWCMAKKGQLDSPKVRA